MQSRSSQIFQERKIPKGLMELQVRIGFVLLGMLVFRIGAHIPVPGLDLARLADVFHSHSQGILGLFNMFSGGGRCRA